MGGGTVEPVEWGEGYREDVLSFVDPHAIAGLRVVADGSNGMAGPTIGPILERFDDCTPFGVIPNPIHDLPPPTKKSPGVKHHRREKPPGAI